MITQNPMVQQAAQNLLMAIENGHSGEQVKHCAEALVVALGGRRFVAMQLSPQFVLYYTVALLLCSPNA